MATEDHEQMQEAQEKDLTPYQGRREFLKGCAGLGLLALGGEIAYSAVRFIAPWGQVKEYTPVPVPMDQLNEGEATRVQYGPDVVLVVMVDGQVRAFNAACTHLQCLVEWDSQQRKFLCPCHAGIFDSDGKNISGPPPLPLQSIETRIENDTLIVGA